MTTLHQPLGQEKKNVRKRIGTRVLACAIAAALLAGCGGGGGGSATPPLSSGGKSTQSVKVTVKVPGKNGVMLKNGKRVPAYISRNTLGMGIDWVSHSTGFTNNQPDTAPMFGVALDPALNAGICNDAGNNDGSFTCTFYVPGVSVGYQDIKLTMWDADPAAASAGSCASPSGYIYGSGCSFSGAHALSTDVETDQAVLQNQNNTWGYTLLPVVDSVALDVSPETLVDGTAASGNVNVIVKDADGNVIIGGENFLDQNGEPLTITLASTSSHVTLGTTSFSASDGSENPQTGTYLSSTLSYDGTDMTAESLVDPLTVSVGSASIGGSIANFDLKFTKSSTGLGVPGVPQVGFQTSAASAPAAIAAGAPGDSNVYVVENNAIQQISTATGATGTTFTVTGAALGDLVLGADNDLWFLDTATNKVGKFNPLTSGATIDPAVAETASAAPATATHIVSAGDGKIYVGSTNGSIYSVAPQTMTYSGEVQYAMNSGSIAAMASGLVVSNGGTYDPGVCATVGSNSGCFDVLNPGTPNHSDGTSTGFGWDGAAGANALAIGPDHLLYMGEGGQVEARALTCTVNASVGACLHPLYTYPASGNVSALTVGHDGTIWFVETALNGNVIGHIQPGNGAQGTVNEYGTQIFGSSTPAAAAKPYGIALGADNNLWFTDDSVNSSVDQVVP